MGPHDEQDAVGRVPGELFRRGGIDRPRDGPGSQPSHENGPHRQEVLADDIRRRRIPDDGAPYLHDEQALAIGEARHHPRGEIMGGMLGGILVSMLVVGPLRRLAALVGRAGIAIGAVVTMLFANPIAAAANPATQWWILGGWIALGVVLTVAGHFRGRASMHVPESMLDERESEPQPTVV